MKGPLGQQNQEPLVSKTPTTPKKTRRQKPANQRRNEHPPRQRPATHDGSPGPSNNPQRAQNKITTIGYHDDDTNPTHADHHQKQTHTDNPSDPQSPTAPDKTAQPKEADQHAQRSP
jgi:hypothetical protein